MRTLVRTLQGAGAIVTPCQRVEGALAELPIVDIVLTDFNLAVGTSIRLVEAALKIEKPCIIFTALDSSVDREARAAASLVLVKPVSFDVLAAALTTVLR